MNAPTMLVTARCIARVEDHKRTDDSYYLLLYSITIWLQKFFIGAFDTGVQNNSSSSDSRQSTGRTCSPAMQHGFLGLADIDAISRRGCRWIGK